MYRTRDARAQAVVTLGGMDDERDVQCPYCFEWIALYIDPDTRGGFVQDCDVCCRPWRVVVTPAPEPGDPPQVLVDRS